MRSKKTKHRWHRKKAGDYPEIGKEYLVQYAPPIGERRFWIEKYEGLIIDEKPVFEMEQFEIGQHPDECSIIAWMELPKPYGGKKNETD